MIFLTKWKETEIGRIPEEWDIKKLYEIAKFVEDKIEIGNISLPNYVSTENMLPNKEGITTITSKPLYGKATTFREGDILFSNIRTYFKKIWLARFIGGCSNDVLVIRANEKIYERYLYYYLSQNIFFNYTVLSSKGTKMPRGDKEAIMHYPISVPPLTEQKAIANVLSDLDSKIELNNQMNATLEAMAQAIFKHWFIDFEFPDENGKPYKSSGGKMVDSELGKIPDGWEIKRLGDFVDIIKGVSYRSIDLKDSDNALVTLKSIDRGGGLNNNGFKEYTGEYDQRQKIIDGDVIVAQTDLTQKAEVIGKPAIVRLNTKYKNIIASVDLAIVRPKNEQLNKAFIYYLLNSKMFQNHVSGYTNGTTVLHLNSKAIPEFIFIKPETTVSQQFEVIISSMLEQKMINDNDTSALTNIRDSLLPKLMSGQIRVPLEVIKNA